MRRPSRVATRVLADLLIGAAVFAPAVLPASIAQETPPPAPPPSVAAEDQKAIEALVATAMPVVEKARSLKFAKPVAAAPVTKKDFVERYMRDFTRILGGEERVATTSRLLARLGILREGDDFRTILGKFLEGNIAANYDPETGKVSFLPGSPRTPDLMVHELTHALDDQNFDMKAQIRSWGTNFDRALAYGALAEGDAESVQTRYLLGPEFAKNSNLDQLRAFAEMQAGMILQQRFGATPPAVVLAFKSQYLEGLVFAEALRRGEKGEEAVNAAFRSPPASTEQVLHPEKFLSGEAPVAIALAAPPGDAKAAVSITLGEMCTRILLQSRGVEAKTAAEAAAGWGGDSVALVAFPAGEAVVWATTWDSEADATAFLAALQSAFPVKTGEASDKVTRAMVQRGTSVDFVEAPLDALPAALLMAKEASRK
jgi:hypothetical protein